MNTALDFSALFLSGIGDRIARRLEAAIEECLAALIAWLIALAGGVPA